MQPTFFTNQRMQVMFFWKCWIPLFLASQLLDKKHTCLGPLVSLLGGGGGTSTWILHHFALPLLQLSGIATSPRPRILGWINFYFRVIFHTKFPYRLSTSFKCRTLNKTTYFSTNQKNVIIFGVDTPPLHSVCAGSSHTLHVCAAV